MKEYKQGVRIMDEIVGEAIELRYERGDPIVEKLLEILRRNPKDYTLLWFEDRE